MALTQAEYQEKASIRLRQYEAATDPTVKAALQRELEDLYAEYSGTPKAITTPITAPVVATGLTTNGIVPVSKTNGVSLTNGVKPALQSGDDVGPAIQQVGIFEDFLLPMLPGLIGEFVGNGNGFDYNWAIPGIQGYVNGVPISGPGVPEPPQHMIKKHWKVKVESQKHGTFQMYYWLLHDGRCMSYHSPTEEWHIWKPKKHIVISTNPRVKTLMKLNRLNKKVDKMLRPYAKVRTKFVGSGKQTLSPLEKSVLAAAGK